MKTKNLMKVLGCALLLSTEVGAQTVYDASKFSGSDLNGTARFVGMGGAMGALGGDISTIGTNPAGIGVYRSNDLMTSFGFNYTTSESNFNGSIMNSNKYRGSFDNIGFVYSSKIGNQTALKYVNFGFNYHKAKSFNRNFAMSGDMGGVSQTDQMANMSNRIGNSDYDSEILSPSSLGSGDAYTYSDVPWLGVLGYQAYLINPYYIKDNAGNNIPQKDDNGNLITDKDGNPIYLKEYSGYLNGANYINGQFRSKERGGIDVYDFNLAFNINDRLYVGATLGAYDVNYSRTTEYTESFFAAGDNLDRGNYTLNNWYKVEGTGVDFKLGFILRPIENSPLRIGAAIHTPVYYNLSTYNTADLQYNTYSLDKLKYVIGTVSPYDKLGKPMEGQTDYKLRTPWKYNLSLGYTIGSSVALGAEYEYKDYSSAKLSDNYGTMTGENSMMKEMLKGVNTIRLGAEIKLVPEFAIRAGYNHSNAAFTNEAYKQLPYNSIHTDTDYANEKSINNYTLGLGYRTGSFYADIAYQYSAYKEDFYAFDNTNLAKTIVNNDKQQVLLTLGFRF